MAVWKRLTLGIVIIITFICLHVDGYNTEKLEGIELYRYTEFSDVWPFFFQVPDDCSAAIWTFSAAKKPNSCEYTTVKVYLQHGSLPFINPLNETIPENFFAYRTSLSGFDIPITNTTVLTSLTNPLAGAWYGVAYLPYTDNRVKPKGLFTKCTYMMYTSFKYVKEPLIDTMLLDQEHKVNLLTHGSKLLRIFLHVTVVEYTVEVTACTGPRNSSSCLVDLYTRAGAVPTEWLYQNSANCTEAGNGKCRFSVKSPSVKSWHYLLVKSVSHDDLDLTVVINAVDCDPANGSEIDPYSTNIKAQAGQSCVLHPLLDRLQYMSLFKIKFGYIVNDTLQDNVLTLKENETRVLPFEIKPELDTGGTLGVQVAIKEVTSLEQSDPKVTILACLLRDRIPVYREGEFCIGNGTSFELESQGSQSSQVYLPYPEPGVWFISMVMKCKADNSSKANKSSAFQPCNQTSMVVLAQVMSEPCMDGKCTDHGKCSVYLHGQVAYSSCQCEAGWRGYACTDGSHAVSIDVQLQELLFLTLSNIFFLPPIILAIYRQHFLEAFVYAYTMVFSAIYHACDGDRLKVYKWCPLHYSVLSFCDFLGSSASIWVTIVAMMKPPDKVKVTLQVAGPMSLAVGVLYDKTSYLLFAVPCGIGLIGIFISWTCRCQYRKQCYPAKWRYLLCLLPGLILAVGGLCIFALVETKENYLYLHSAWHAVMALSVIFLLPPGKRKGGRERDSVIGSTYQPLPWQHEENHVI
ncbi:hypothetical protein ACJMK2_041736 [Sinanodonta woodiana]|uniref:EGF-like domain-containing protein n=1 Tax=Sinanodonta woodiana TaxID=1069815 RepID=A0ABD3W6Z7_SINWO